MKLAQALGDFGASEIDIEKVFSVALRHGGALAEFFFEETESTRVLFENHRIDRITDGIDRGVGLRIVFEGRSVYGYTTDLTETSLMNLAGTLSEGVRHQITSGTQNPKKSNAIDWQFGRQTASEILDYEIQKSPRKQSLSEKVEFVQRADRAARRMSQAVTQVAAVYMDSQRKILVVNSDGLIAPDTKTYLQMVVQVVAEHKKRVESAYESDGGYVGIEFLDKKTPEELAEKATRKVLTLLSAKPAPSGAMPVVLSSEAGGTMIHEAVGHGLEADLACNQLSVYQDKLGQKVASSLITVIDDGTMPERRGSYRFDDEGTPSKKNVLIENGVLKSYMVDRVSGMKFDLMPTGNGRRESFRHKPIVRMTNTYIAPGKDNPEEILSSTSWGVFVKGMGGGQVNTVTGDFVFAITEGYLIEDGKLGSPIRGATLVGNGPKVLESVDRVGNDLGFSTGTCGKDGQGAPVTDAQPTLRIPQLTVGGEVPVTEYWSDKHIK